MTEKLKLFLETLGLRSDAGEDEIHLTLCSMRECPELTDELKEEARALVGSDSYREGSRFLPETVNDKERSISGVLATEQPVRMIDWKLYEIVDEVLVADGLDLSNLRDKNQIPFQDSHHRYSCHNTIGSTINIRVEENQVVGDNIFSSVEEDLFTKAKEGHLRDTSVGYEVLSSSYIEPEQTDTINGKEYTAGTRTLKIATKWRLLENSLTPVGADNRAGLRSKKNQPLARTAGEQQEQKQGNNNMNEQLRKLLIDSGMPESCTDDQARGFMVAKGVPAGSSDEVALGFLQGRQAQTPATPAPSAPAAAPQEPQRSAEELELIEQGKRSKIVEDVRGSFANFPDHSELLTECERKIMAGDMTADGARQALLKAKADQTPAPGHVYTGETNVDHVRKGMQKGMLLRSGSAQHLSEEDKKIGNDYRFMSIPDMCRQLCEMRGENVRGLPPSEILKRAITSGDFPEIVSATTRTVIGMAYGNVKETWRQYTAVESVTDLEEHTLLQFGGSGELAKVLEDGEFKTGVLATKSEKIQAAKFGEDIPFTWEMLLADKVNFLFQAPAVLAARWAKTLNNLPIKLLNANAKLSDGKALFHDDHNNLIHGTANAITDVTKAKAAIKAHRLALLKQTAIDAGKNKKASEAANIELTHVLSGVDNYEYIVNALSKTIEDNSGDTFLRNLNVVPIEDSLVGMGAGGSEIALYGIGDGNVNPGIKMALLNGEAAPMLSQMENKRDGLCIRIKGVAQTGCADGRSVSKSTGLVQP